MVTVEEFGKEKYEEGFRKGMWKGIKETKFEIAKKLIIKDVSLYNISYVCDIGMATLGELKECLGKGIQKTEPILYILNRL